MGVRDNPPATLVHQVDCGTAELRPDPRRAAGWILSLDGVAQSYVDLDDPRHLEFEYVRRIAAVLDLAGPPGRPLRVLHLGGGGLTLPRYVAATRPGSAQRVVERDAALVQWLSRALPSPPGIEVRVADARQWVPTDRPGSYDVVISDVYVAGAMPPEVSSADFAAAVGRLLRPGGLLTVNVMDVPPLAYTRTVAAALRAGYPDVCLLATPRLARGRRAGNVVLVAATAVGGVPAGRLAAAVSGDDPPGRVLHGSGLDAFLSGARPPVARPGPDREPGGATRRRPAPQGP